jgi:hypothetical protein
MFRRDKPSSTRGLLKLLALIVIVLVEVQMNTGPARALYPLLAVCLLSPFAQTLWALILVVRLLLTSAVSWPPLEQLMFADFIVVRLLFVWIMLAQNRLVGTNRAVELLSRALSPHTGALRGFSIAAVAVIVVLVVFFQVSQAHVRLLLAAFLAYVAARLPKATPRKRMRTGPAEMALVMASVLVFVLLFELSVRLFAAPPTVVRGKMYRAHPRALFCLAENARVEHTTKEFSSSFTISDQGFRDRHYGKKDESAYRILCLGDSMTMGHGVSLDETFVKVLERLLAEHKLNKRIEVINAGTGGYGIWQERIMLNEKCFALEPDIVVLQIYPENDVRDELVRVGKVLRSYDTGWQNYLRDWRRQRTTRVVQILRGSSSAFAFVHDRYRRPLLALRARLRPRFRRMVSSFPPSETGRPWWLESSLREYYPELEEGWLLLEETICGIADDCWERGVVCMSFVLAAPHETSHEHFENLRRAFGFDPDLYDRDKIHRLAGELCQRNRLDFVQTVNQFREKHQQSANLYYWADGHMTASGHRLCAEILYEHLLKTHLGELMPTSGDGTET